MAHAEAVGQRPDPRKVCAFAQTACRVKRSHSLDDLLIEGHRGRRAQRPKERGIAHHEL